MNRAPIALLLMPLLACHSTDSPESGESDEMTSSILEGTALDDGFTLRAGSCSRVGDIYELTGVRVSTADGKEVTASTGTMSSSGGTWQIELSGVHMTSPGGIAFVEQVVFTCPKQRG